MPNIPGFRDARDVLAARPDGSLVVSIHLPADIVPVPHTLDRVSLTTGVPTHNGRGERCSTRLDVVLAPDVVWSVPLSDEDPNDIGLRDAARLAAMADVVVYDDLGELRFEACAVRVIFTSRPDGH